MMRAAIAILAVLIAAPATAHDLRVFAFVEDDMVNVEAAFSSGRLPQTGEIRVVDDQGAEIERHAIDPEGVTRFALPEGHAARGVVIEVDAGNGHSDYWVLTPEDIARGEGGS